MLRKWEWIKEQCLKRGLVEPAKVAGEIDDMLFENYDAEHTPKWIAYYRHTAMDAAIVSYEILMEIASNPDYCIACLASDCNCFVCRFAKLSGNCGDWNSVYKRFFVELKKDWDCEQIE